MKFRLKETPSKPTLLIATYALMATVAVAGLLRGSAWVLQAVAYELSHTVFADDDDAGLQVSERSGRVEPAAAGDGEVALVGQNGRVAPEFQWPDSDDLLKAALDYFRKTRNWQACLYLSRKDDLSVGIDRAEKVYFMELYLQETSETAMTCLTAMGHGAQAKTMDMGTPEVLLLALPFLDRVDLLKRMNEDLERKKMPPEVRRAFLTLFFAKGGGSFFSDVIRSPNSLGQLASREFTSSDAVVRALLKQDPSLFGGCIGALFNEVGTRVLVDNDRLRALVQEIPATQTQRDLWEGTINGEGTAAIDPFVFSQMRSVHRWVLANHVLKSLKVTPKALVGLFENGGVHAKIAGTIARFAGYDASIHRSLLFDAQIRNHLYEGDHAKAVAAFVELCETVSGRRPSSTLKLGLVDRFAGEVWMVRRLLRSGGWEGVGVDSDALLPDRMGATAERVFPLKNRTIEQQILIMLCQVNRGRDISRVPLVDLKAYRRNRNLKPLMLASDKRGFLTRSLRWINKEKYND